MLGVENYNATEDYVFPPRPVDSKKFGNVDQIVQISVGEMHTIFLRNDKTVWGIGSNQFDAMTINQTSTTEFLQLNIPEKDTKCISEGKCSIDFVFAGSETTFLAISNSSDLGGVEMEPTCFGKSHLEVGICSGNGMCLEKEKCSCFKGFYGDQCQLKFDCSALQDCSNHGICKQLEKCECFDFADGPDCSLPVCTTFILLFFSFLTLFQKKCFGKTNSAPDVCSGNGQCSFSETDNKSTCKCTIGWNGKKCGNGPKSPFIFSCGLSSFIFFFIPVNFIFSSTEKSCL